METISVLIGNRAVGKPHYKNLRCNRINLVNKIGIQTTLIRSAFYGNRLPHCMETAYHVVGKPDYKRLGFYRTNRANS